jgi:hypothetical protein
LFIVVPQQLLARSVDPRSGAVSRRISGLNTRDAYPTQFLVHNRPEAGLVIHVIVVSSFNGFPRVGPRSGRE